MKRPSRSAGAIEIIFEDDDLLVVNKPAGLITSTTPREPRLTLWQGVRDYVDADGQRNARAGLIHRLDREASGLLVFSKNHSAYESLKAQFFKHTVGRVYTAVVSPAPHPAEGKIRSKLIERADGTVHSTDTPREGQLAITHYATIRTLAGSAVLRVTLETGRKHQIRAHLSQRGWPIVGDCTYGGVPCAGGLLLAAVELELDHPATGRRMSFKAPWPARITEWINQSV